MPFSAWLKKKTLAVNSVYIDADIPFFVAWFDAAADPDFAALCIPGFGDIRTTLPDETTELARYITPGGVCYVAMPVTAASNQEIVVFFNNPAATDYAPGDPFGQYNVMPAEYWKTFHEETPSASFPANDEANGTANYNGTAVNLNGKRTLAGPVKYCWDFTNTVIGAANADRIDQGANGVDFSAGPPFSVSCWTTIVNSGVPASSNDQVIISAYQSFSGQRGFFFTYLSSVGKFRFRSWDAGGSSTPNLYNSTNLSAEPNQTWHHVAFTMDGAGNWAFYIDGVLDGSGTTTPRNFNPSTPQTNIGSFYRSGFSLYDGNHAGYMADLRCFETTELTPEWIKAEYQNSAALDFWIVGPMEDNGATGPTFPDGTKWGFTLNGDVIQPETVKGWDSLSSQYTFDGVFIRTPNSGELTFCGGTAYDAISALDPCQDHIVELFYDCGTGPESFAKYHVSQKDISFDCETCSATLSLNDGNLLQLMERKGGEETCWTPDEAIELVTGEPPSTASEKSGPFQVVSGGNVERSIPIRSVLSLLNLMLDRKVPGSVVTSDLLSTPFLSEIQEIAIPPGFDNTAGEAVLRLTTMFGSVYEINIADGTAIPSDAYAKGLMYVEAGPNAAIDMSVDEICCRIQRATSDGVDTIEIVADYSFTVELFDATATLVATGTVTQDFQYGLEGLSITPQAITNQKICLGWTDLISSLIAVSSPVIRDGSDEIQINDAEGELSVAGTINDSDIGERVRAFDDTWLVSEYNISQDFEIDDFEASQAAWIWKGDLQPIRLSSDTAFGAIVTWTFGGAQPTMFSIAGGSFTSFIFPAPANLIIASIELEINGNATGWSYLATLPASGTINVQDITNTPEWEAPEPVCLNPGDVVSLSIRSVGGALPPGTNLAVGFDMVLALNIPCFEAANFDQDDIDDLQFVLTDTKCCGEQNGVSLAASIDAGIGYALTEQLCGLHNYENTHFMIMTDPTDPTDPLAFPRRFYFSDIDPNIAADCPCYADSEQVFFYYNILLQRLHAIHKKRAIIPTGYTWDAYLFRSFVNLSGQVRGGTAADSDIPAVATIETSVAEGTGYYGYDTFTFKKCFTVEDFLAFKNGGLLSINDPCVCPEDGTIRSMAFTPNMTGAGSSEMTILMKCTELDNSCDDIETDLVRGVTVDDSDLSTVTVATTGSLDGAIDISLDPLAQYTDKICLTDKNLALEIIREVELMQIEYHYDGVNTIIDSITVNSLILPADAATLSGLITPLSGTCGYSYDKQAIDTNLKGYDFVNNANYAYTENALGFNYYVSFFGWPFLVDSDGTPLDDGAYHKIKGTVTLGGEKSDQSQGEVRRSIKRIKNNMIHLIPTGSGGHSGNELRYTYVQASTQTDSSYPALLATPAIGTSNWWELVPGQAYIDDADGSGFNAIVSTVPVVKPGYALGGHQIDLQAVTQNGMGLRFKAAYYATAGTVPNNQIYYAFCSGAAPLSPGFLNFTATWILVQTPGSDPNTIASASLVLRDDLSQEVLYQRSSFGIAFTDLAIDDPYVLQKWTSEIKGITSDGLEIEQNAKIYVAETY